MTSRFDGALEKFLFTSEKSATDRRLPDYNYIRKELLRNGGTKNQMFSEENLFVSNRIPNSYKKASILVSISYASTEVYTIFEINLSCL